MIIIITIMMLIIIQIQLGGEALTTSLKINGISFLVIYLNILILALAREASDEIELRVFALNPEIFNKMCFSW